MDEDEDNEVDNEVDQEDIQWLDCMQKEGLTDENIKEQVDEAMMISQVRHLKDENKELGKLFRQQKRNYKSLLDYYQNKEFEKVKEKSQDIFESRLDIHKKLKSLNNSKIQFTEISKGSHVLEYLRNVGRCEQVDMRNRFVNGKREYGCTQCKCWKVTPAACENHMYVTHGIGGIHCPFCEHVTGNSRSLYIHTTKQHGINIGDITLKL